MTWVNPAVVRRTGLLVAVALASLLVGATAEIGRALDARGGVNFFPLRKGAYWLYEVRDTGLNTVGLKQVLISDQQAAGNGAMATEFVSSIRDHTLPVEDRPDAPTIIRQNPDGSITCIDCGGVMLPAQIKDGVVWQSAGADEWCSLSTTPLTFRVSDRKDVLTVIVQCNSLREGKSSTRVYAEGVGPVLALFREQRGGKWLERVERLREQRTINPPKMPPAPGKTK